VAAQDLEDGNAKDSSQTPIIKNQSFARRPIEDPPVR